MTVEERLARVEESVVRIEGYLKGVLDQHDRTLYGNGSPGHMTRIDRLEQDAHRRGRVYTWVASLLSAIVTGLVVVQFRG